MKTIRNLIFDLDGTLIDSSAGVIEAVNYALRQSGLPPQEGSVIKGYIGSPLYEMFADFTALPYPPLLKLFRHRAIHSVVGSAIPLDGVDSTISELFAEGYRMGIATTKVIEQVKAITHRLDWDQYFLASAGGDEVKAVKPAPDVFLLSMKRLDCDPDESIVIGDTANDVYGAKAAGLPVIAIESEFGKPEDLRESKPDYTLDSFAQLPQLLRQIQSDGN